VYKKSVIASLTIALVGFTLTVAANLASAATIRFMGGWGAEDDKANKEMIAEFMRANPDVKVEYENVPDYTQKYLAELATDTPPDTLYVFRPWSHTYSGRGAFLDLTPLIERDKAEIKPNDFYPGMLSALSYKGKVYALPIWTAVSGVYYNKGILDKVGVPYPDASWTWDTLVHYGHKITVVKDGKVELYAFTPDGFSLSWGAGPIIWVWSNGGELISKDKSQFKLSEAPAKQALSYFLDLIYKHNISVSPEAHKEQSWWMRFLSETVAIWNTTSWNNAYVGSQATFDWDVAPTFKSPFTDKRSALIHTRGASISRASKNKEAAWKFVKFLSSPKFQEFYSRNRGYQPTRRSQIGAYYRSYSGERKPNLRVFESSITYANYIPILDSAKQNTAFWNLINSEWEKVILQKQSLEDFYKVVVPQARNILK
jgi:multiple sugar transport system substrate-binding protein